MGTVLESDSIDIIYEASKKMMETVHNLGIDRVEVVIKVDSRRDKHVKMEEKLDSIKKHMENWFVASINSKSRFLDEPPDHINIIRYNAIM